MSVRRAANTVLVSRVKAAFFMLQISTHYQISERRSGLVRMPRGLIIHNLNEYQGFD